MNSEWPTVPLKEFISLQRGHDLPKQDRGDGDVPVMGASGVSGYHDTAKCSGPGVIIGRSGAIGEVAYQPNDYWPLNTSLYVTDFKGNDERFVYYALSTLHLKRFDSGSVQPMLNRNYITDVPVPCPSIDVQESIADTLGTLDDKIEHNHKVNQTLDSIASALFESWFVNYDPFDEMKQSGKGQIPSNFEVDYLPELMEIVLGGTPKSDINRYYGGDVMWAKAKAVSQVDEPFISATEKTITQEGLEESSAELVPMGTTVITARGTVGETALTPKEMATNQTCYGLIPHNYEEKYFLYYLVTSLIRRLKSRSHGTVFDTINMSTLREQEIILPPQDIRRKFDTTVEPMMDMILNNQQENRALTEVRETLHQPLITGKVRPKEVDLEVAGTRRE